MYLFGFKVKDVIIYLKVFGIFFIDKYGYFLGYFFGWLWVVMIFINWFSILVVFIGVIVGSGNIEWEKVLVFLLDFVVVI